MSIGARSGRYITPDEHLAQSVGFILNTPIGTVVCLRDFGSYIPELLDQPNDRLTRVRIFGATATALHRWEKRLRLRRVDLVAGDKSTRAILEIDAERRDRPAPNNLVRLRVPLVSRAVNSLTA